MTDGKNAVGLTGFPTPNAATGIAGYLLFLFDDKGYAQWLLGALEPLVNAYNFYESGDLTPDEAAELFRQIVQDAPYNLKTCANPAGGKIIRVAPNGHVEQLSDANTWETPDGDYTIPPIPERTDGTPQDQMCLAAKNAANVLQLLYENITDSFNADLDTAEAQTALVLGIISLIGAEFAPITFALVTFFGIVFSVLYGLLEAIGADLWDADFTDSLVCILKNCATNDAGVVTFDWDCFNNALAAQTTVVPLTFDQLRLFGQIQYLLLVIGGVDALNTAGATTAITDDDCSACCEDGDFCHVWGNGYTPFFDQWGATFSGGAGTITSGVWTGANDAPNGTTNIVVHFAPAQTFTIGDVTVTYSNPDNNGNRPGVILRLSGTQVARIDSANTAHSVQSSASETFSFGGVTCDEVRVINIADGLSQAVTVELIQMTGHGDCCLFGDDNC